MKAIFFVLTFVVAHSALAAEFTGVDGLGRACHVYVESGTSSGPQGEEQFGVNVRFSTYSFRGLIATRAAANELTFDNLVMDSGDGYTRVIGAPITVAGLGILTLTGSIVPMEDGFVAATAKGHGVWGWWKKKFTCMGLKARL